MNRNNLIIYSSITALVVAAVFGIGMRSRGDDFKRTVNAALSASVNYDNQFIDMVNRLEMELATRASFGYEGGKDPMTGQVRQVVVAPKPVAKTPTAQGAADTSKKSVADPGAPEPIDSMRLTAIIYEGDLRNYTAVVMSGERSFSVNVGDRVNDRTIKSISEAAIIMENDSLTWRYDVSGKRSITPRKKPSAAALP